MRSSRKILPLGAVALLVLQSACQTAGTPSPRASRDALYAEEMEPWAGHDLLTVIQRLRPQWMMARKGLNFTERLPVGVVVDGMRQEGTVDVLRRYRAADVAEARLLSASDATTLFGVGMMSGAIVVKLKRGVP